MIACLIAAFAAGAAAADGPLDQQIILVGRDEAALPLPDPWQPPAFAFPEPDMARPETPLAPLAAPPVGEWADLLPEAGYTYVGCAGTPPERSSRESSAGGPGGMETHSV
jgi:hypothetical protein